MEAIGRLFWTKEVKNLVDKYRAEGTLNKRAVRNILSEALACFFLFLVFGGTLVFSEISIEITSLIVALLFIITLLTSKYATYKHINKRILPYTLGELCEAHITHISYNFNPKTGSGYNISYAFPSTKLNTPIKGYVNRINKKFMPCPLPEIGDKFPAFLCIDRENYHNLYITEYLINGCLDKARLNQLLEENNSPRRVQNIDTPSNNNIPTSKLEKFEKREFLYGMLSLLLYALIATLFGNIFNGLIEYFKISMLMVVFINACALFTLTYIAISLAEKKNKKDK